MDLPYDRLDPPVAATLLRALPCATPANDDEIIVSPLGLTGGRRVFRGTRVPVEGKRGAEPTLRRAA